LSRESLYGSLNPRANKKILLKSFEKTSAKGGKPLIKTHDKRFLIKEISEEERDFFLSLVKEYHSHLNNNPRSLLAKIYGCFSIRVNNKNKVYHILMENLDPLDDEHILFKYDMKFSTVNRKEINSNNTIRAIKNTFLKQLPWAKELFDFPEEGLEEGKSNTRTSGGYKTALKKNELKPIDERSSEDEAPEPKEESKQDPDAEESETFFDMKKVLQDNSGTKKTFRKEGRTCSEVADPINTRFSSQTRKNKMKKGMSRVYSRVSYSSLHYEEEETVDPSTLKKLGLLKDEDFTRLHKALFVNMDCKMEVEMLNSSLGKDVKFLTDLNIMDYSLFVVILQAPNVDPILRGSNNTTNDSDSEEEVRSLKNNSELTKAISSLAASNKYVLYSRKRNFIYLVGLIDYLQKYIRKKKLERLGKQIVAFNNLNEGDNDFSCQPPEQYSVRFMEKGTQVFIVSDDHESSEEEDQGDIIQN